MIGMALRRLQRGGVERGGRVVMQCVCDAESSSAMWTLDTVPSHTLNDAFKTDLHRHFLMAIKKS